MKGRKQIAYERAELIERENHRGKPVIIRQRLPSRWRAGVCKICGESFDYISQDHAHKHGFKDADAMSKAEVVGWTE